MLKASFLTSWERVSVDAPRLQGTPSFTVLPLLTALETASGLSLTSMVRMKQMCPQRYDFSAQTHVPLKALDSLLFSRGWGESLLPHLEYSILPLEMSMKIGLTQSRSVQDFDSSRCPTSEY